MNRKRLASQRRFLILTSLAVVAFYFLGAGVERHGTLQGFTFRFENPENVRPLLWLIWLWSFVRYLQFLNSMAQSIKRTVAQSVAMQDQAIVTRIALHRAKQIAKQGRLDLQEGHKPKYPVQRVTAVTLHPDTPLGQVLSGKPEQNPTFDVLPDGGRRYRQVMARYWYDTKKNSTGTDSARIDFEIGRWRVLCVHYIASLQAAFWLPKSAEHIFPVVFAVVAYAFILYQAFYPPLF